MRALINLNKSLSTHGRGEIEESEVNNHDFVATIKEAVRDAAITDTIDVLRNPPGRKPSQQMMERAEWYRSLDDEQRRILAGLIGDAVHNAIFGFLCVLDGIRGFYDSAEPA